MKTTIILNTKQAKKIEELLHRLNHVLEERASGTEIALEFQLNDRGGAESIIPVFVQQASDAIPLSDLEETLAAIKGDLYSVADFGGRARSKP